MPLKRPQTAGRHPADLPRPKKRNIIRHSLSKKRLRQTSQFVDGKVILSQEGTTQGNPLAMALYGNPLLPLVKLLENTDIVQKW